MNFSPSTSLEKARLYLIHHNTSFPVGQKMPQPSISETIHYFLKALEFSDNTFSSEIEHYLVSVGAATIPFLVDGMSSEHANVRSVCAMALIRIGQPSLNAVLKGYKKAQHMQKETWAFEFILSELRAVLATDLDIPTVVVGVQSEAPVLEKVS